MTTVEIAAIAQLSEQAKPLLAEEMGPSRFVRLLESKHFYRDAIHFLAHGLPIDMAIRWGAACSRELLAPEQLELDRECLAAIDSWLTSRDDPSRWRARDVAERSGLRSAPDLIAMAVFFSGGSLTPAGAPAADPPPYVANKMVGSAIQLAVFSQLPEKTEDRFRKTLEISRQLAKLQPQG